MGEKKKKEKIIPVKVKGYNYPHGVPETKKDGAILLECFTLHPPKKEISVEDLKRISAYVTELELTKTMDNVSEKALLTKGGTFERTNNPVYAIEAFLLTHKAGLYPPIWVLNFMAKVFTKYHETFGEVSLDDLFGFKKWKGQDPAFKQVMNEERDEILMIDVFRLHLLGFSIEDASYMVAMKLKETQGWDRTGLGLRKLSAKTIEFKYKKDWKKNLEYKHFKKATQKWLNENKKSFLNSFPPESFPHHHHKKRKHY